MTRHTMSERWVVRGVAAAATAGLMLAGAAPALAEDAPSGPKNVIYMIGDGMGYNHVDATSLYETGNANWRVESNAEGVTERLPGTPTQVFESWDHVAMSTYSVEGHYDPATAWSHVDWVKDGFTDSAAAATAMATGKKTYNGGIGILPDMSYPENLTERAIAVGKAAGLVTSVPYNHATPAGFIAHTESRNDYQGIGRQMIDSDLTVVMGAGHPYYSDSNEQLDEPDWYYMYEEDYERLTTGQTDWAYITDKDDFEALTTGETPERVFGLAQSASTLQQGRDSAVPGGVETAPYQTPMNEGVPNLDVMAKGALNVLEEDEDGFFLMIEGGAIDWTGHANDIARNIEETQAFNAAVEAVVDWVETNSSWDETLVVVTADHETGYLSGVDTAGIHWDSLKGAAGYTPTVGWYSDDHTNSLVPFFYKGAYAEQLGAKATGTDPVRGAYLDNTALAKLLLDELWLLGDDEPGTPGTGGDIPVTADIPGTGGGDDDPVGPGSLVLSIAPGTAELSDARNAGTHLRLTGQLPTVSVTDSRAEGAGWAVTGQSSNLVSGDSVVGADRLGWAPFLQAGAAQPGGSVATAQNGGAGLAVPATLGSASGDARVGTAELGADMVLEVPVGTEGGSYAGGITVSLFPQD